MHQLVLKRQQQLQHLQKFLSEAINTVITHNMMDDTKRLSLSLSHAQHPPPDNKNQELDPSLSLTSTSETLLLDEGTPPKKIQAKPDVGKEAFLKSPSSSRSPDSPTVLSPARKKAKTEELDVSEDFLQSFRTPNRPEESTTTAIEDFLESLYTPVHAKESTTTELTIAPKKVTSKEPERVDTDILPSLLEPLFKCLLPNGLTNECTQEDDCCSPTEYQDLQVLSQDRPTLMDDEAGERKFFLQWWNDVVSNNPHHPKEQALLKGDTMGGLAAEFCQEGLETKPHLVHMLATPSKRANNRKHFDNITEEYWSSMDTNKADWQTANKSIKEARKKLLLSLGQMKNHLIKVGEIQQQIALLNITIHYQPDSMEDAEEKQKIATLNATLERHEQEAADFRC